MVQEFIFGQAAEPPCRYDRQEVLKRTEPFHRKLMASPEKLTPKDMVEQIAGVVATVSCELKTGARTRIAGHPFVQMHLNMCETFARPGAKGPEIPKAEIAYALDKALKYAAGES